MRRNIDNLYHPNKPTTLPDLHHAMMIPRRFCTSSRIGNKSVIPQIILDQLRDTTNIAPTQKQHLKERSKQIFLKPEEVADKRFERIVESIKISSKLRQPATDQFRIIESKVEPSTTIDAFKPLLQTISKNKYNSVKNDLVNSFKHSQLSDYLQKKYETPEYAGYRRSIRANKAKLAERILDHIWNVKQSNVFTAIDDLLVKKSVKLSKSDLFLLLSENGFILQYLARVGAKISFDSKNDTIEFVGTSSQVNNAEINFISILNNSHREKIDLSTIKKLFIEKYGEFSLSTIGRNTEVYFNQLDNDIYELITLNENQIKRSKRLLLWLLNYNQHLKEDLLLTSREGEFIPFKDDDALSWNTRNLNLFVFKDKKPQSSENKLFLGDMLKYSDSRLKQGITSFEDEILDAKSLPLDVGKNEQDLQNDSWKLLNDLGIVSDVETDEVPVEEENEIKEIPQTNEQFDFPLDEHQVDTIYEKLVDFSYRSALNGVTDDKLNKPIFTVTVGDILFEGEKSRSILPKSPELVERNKYKFNTNVTLANDKVISLPLYEYPELSIREVNHFLNKDPHSYVIQLKFLPSPYKSDGTAIENQFKYPPVEIWVDLNDRSKPDVDTMNVVTVEGENNCFVSLPTHKADMKVCCQLSGDILKGEVGEIEEKIPENLNDILNETTKRYSRFESQPGIVKFLNESKLDFSGKVATSIAQHVDLNINGEVVRYHYINASYRRQLNFNYPTQDNNSDRLVQFNIVEGGSLGGRKVEINFVGDLSGTIEKEELKQVLKDATRFIGEL